MKNKLLNIYKLFLLSCLLVGTQACEDQRSTFEQYANKGETIYIGRAYPLAQPGNEKVNFIVGLTSDPKITKCVVKWTQDNTEQQKEFPVTRKPLSEIGNTPEDSILREVGITELIQFTLDGVKEGVRTFAVSFADEAGNISLARETTANVYGPNYAQAIKPLTRIATSINANIVDGTIEHTFNWAAAAGGLDTLFFTYGTPSGTKTLSVPRSVNSTTVKDLDRTKGYSFHSTFKPGRSFEIFLSDTISKEAKFPPIIKVFDKTKWGLDSLSYDMTRNSTGPPAAEIDWHLVWNGKKGGEEVGKIWLKNAPPKPAHVTIDLGVADNLNKIRIDRGLIADGNGRVTPKTYQIWAIGDKPLADITTTINIHDGTKTVAERQKDWEAEMTTKGWTKIVQETDLPDGHGHTSKLDNPIKARYLRFLWQEAQQEAAEIFGVGEITVELEIK